MSIERGEQMQRLARHFKADAKLRADTLAELDGWGIATEDLIEGVERLIATREVSTWPKPATIRKHAADARFDRLRARNTSGPDAHDDGRPATAEERQQCRDIITLYRAGLIWCVVCRAYGPFCREHDGAVGREANARESANAVASLEPGLREAASKPKTSGARRRIPAKPSPQVQAGIDYVIAERAKRIEREGKRKPKDTGLTPLADSLEVPF